MASQSLTPYRSRLAEPFRPTSPFLSFYRQANRLFEDVFRDFDDAREALTGILAPSIDITHNEQETRITAELPGVKEEDIDLSIEQDMLTIRAEKRLETEGENDTRHVKERMYGTLQRSLRLQQPIDPEQVRAHFDRGVLTVIIPHEGEHHRHHRIAIDRGAPPSTQSPAGKDAETQH